MTSPKSLFADITGKEQVLRTRVHLVLVHLEVVRLGKVLSADVAVVLVHGLLVLGRLVALRVLDHRVHLLHVDLEVLEGERVVSIRFDMVSMIVGKDFFLLRRNYL